MNKKSLKPIMLSALSALALNAANVSVTAVADYANLVSIA